MLDRRDFFVTTTALALVGLAGCARTPLKLPTATPTPTPTGAAERASADAERDVAALLQALASAQGVRSDEARRWLDLAAVRERHAASLENDVPLSRRAGVAASPSPSATTPTPGTPRGRLLTATRDALTELRDSHLRRALAPGVVDPGRWAAFWASLAASAAQGLSILESSLSPVWLPAVAERTIELLDESTALQAFHSRLAEARFAISTSLGRLPASDAAAEPLGALLESADGWRDVVAAELRRLAMEPSPAAPAYELPAVTNSADAAALAAAVWDGALGAAGQWVAAASSTRGRAVSALVGMAPAGLRFGAGRLDWPGWPDLG